ncbi:Sperm flagellar protein 1 [Chlorella vulgaris]
MALPECTEQELTAIYEWVDTVPLSRPKKSIARDFADGVLMAEIVHYFFPRLVELHNYSPAHNSVQKLYNWTTLNQRVFKRLGFSLAREQYEAVVNAEAHAVERVLKLVRTKMARFQLELTERAARQGDSWSQPDSPAGFGAARQGAAGHHAAPPAAEAAPGDGNGVVRSMSGSIAALRLGDVSSKLAASSMLGRACDGTAPASFPSLDQAVAASIEDREQQLDELRETNEILETKISKLEQLLRLKDAKIQALLARLAADEPPPPAVAAS